MYESAKANGADAETLSKLKGAISKAKSSIRNDIVNSVINGTAAANGIGANDIAKFEANIDAINTMIRDGQVGLGADGIATLTTEVTDAKGVFNAIEDAVAAQERNIESVNRNFDRQQKEIEMRQKEIERAKKEVKSSDVYRSRKADEKAINNNGSKDKK